jgi:hypothetical protein
MARNEKSDAAAMSAVEAFFDEGRDKEAAAELVSEAPVYTEAQQQADELEQEGLADPTAPDGEVSASETPSDTVNQSGSDAAVKKDDGFDPDLRAVAKDFGWSDEKIDRLVAADPELARETFESFAVALAEQSRQYLASVPGNNQPAPAQNVAATVPPAPTSVLPPELSDEALKRFAEENGEHAANLLKVVRDQFLVKQLVLEERLMRAEQAARAQELQTVAAEANTVIRDLASKHPTLYGNADNVNALTVEQYNRRQELASLADQIRAGALAQGRSMSVSQALNHAHYILARDAVKAEARKEVVQAVQKRAKQTTARPTARVNPEARGVKRSEATAMEAYSRRLAELGID